MTADHTASLTAAAPTELPTADLKKVFHCITSFQQCFQPLIQLCRLMLQCSNIINSWSHKSNGCSNGSLTASTAANSTAPMAVPTAYPARLTS